MGKAPVNITQAKFIKNQEQSFLASDAFLKYFKGKELTLGSFMTSL
jgi:hypothetical protein